jgi:hypothetical protein
MNCSARQAVSLAAYHGGDGQQDISCITDSSSSHDRGRFAPAGTTGRARPMTIAAVMVAASRVMVAALRRGAEGGDHRSKYCRPEFAKRGSVYVE